MEQSPAQVAFGLGGGHDICFSWPTGEGDCCGLSVPCVSRKPSCRRKPPLPGAHVLGGSPPGLSPLDDVHERRVAAWVTRATRRRQIRSPSVRVPLVARHLAT